MWLAIWAFIILILCNGSAHPEDISGLNRYIFILCPAYSLHLSDNSCIGSRFRLLFILPRAIPVPETTISTAHPKAVQPAASAREPIMLPSRISRTKPDIMDHLHCRQVIPKDRSMAEKKQQKPCQYDSGKQQKRLLALLPAVS